MSGEIGRREMTDTEYEALLSRRLHERGLSKPPSIFDDTDFDWGAYYAVANPIEAEFEAELAAAGLRTPEEVARRELRGGGDVRFELLRAGFRTRAAVETATDYELLRVRGIGPAGLRKLREKFPFSADQNWTRCPCCDGTGRVRAGTEAVPG